MQWKIPFIEYFRSEKSKISEISAEYTPKPVDVIVKNSLEINTKLSVEQMAVINRFPTTYDSNEENWYKLSELLHNWKNKSDVWALAYNMKLISALNGTSALYVCHSFRRAFLLADGRTAVLNTYVPALILPLLFGSMLHYRFITGPLVSGVERCRLCDGLKAGLIQSLTSTLYPIIYSSISCIYFADYFVTYPTPQSIKDIDSRKYLYRIWLKAIKNNKFGFSSFAIFNFLFAFYLTERENKTIEFMYLSLLRQEYMKCNKIQNK